MMPRNQGDPKRIEGTMTVVGPEGDLVLDAIIGPQGEPGDPMPPFEIEWDSTVTDVGDLPDVETLDESDHGRAWVIGTSIYVFVWDALEDEGEYHEIDAGIPGPKGDAPDINFTAELVAGSGLEIEVEEAGTSTNRHYNLKIPVDEITGPEGPPTNIGEAPDVDVSTPPLDGQGLVWDEGDERWKPGDLSPMATKMISIPRANFIAGTYSASRQEIASLSIAAQPNAWYPDVTGHIRWKRALLSFAQVECEVRIENSGVGSPSTAALCGLGPYDPSTLDATTVSNVLPHFSDVGDPTRAVDPESSTARIPAGQATTLYVILHKIGGTGSYEFAQDTAEILLRLQPVS